MDNLILSLNSIINFMIADMNTKNSFSFFKVGFRGKSEGDCAATQDPSDFFNLI